VQRPIGAGKVPLDKVRVLWEVLSKLLMTASAAVLFPPAFMLNVNVASDGEGVVTITTIVVVSDGSSDPIGVVILGINLWT